MLIDPAPRRALLGAAITLDYTYRDQHGSPADAATTPTVAAVRLSDGTTVTVGSVTKPDNTTGIYQATIAAADNDTLDDLDITWTVGGVGITETWRIVGRYYFDLAIADSLGAAYPGSLPDDTRRRQARDSAEAEAERITRRYWTPRMARWETRIDRTGLYELVAPHTALRTVRSVTTLTDAGATNYTWTADELAAVRPTSHGTLLRNGATWPTGRIRVVYDHGYDSPPHDLAEAVMRRYRWFLTKPTSAVPDRSAGWTETEGGANYRFVPGRDRTGDPDVDGIYWSYQAREIGIA